MERILSALDFRRLWMAVAISQFGSQFTLLAFPLVAAVLLGATPLQMGALTALEPAALSLTSLFAGMVADRFYRRPVLIITSVMRAVLLLAIPVAGWLNALYMWHLYAVAVLVGINVAFFQAAYLPFVVTLLRPEQLEEANSKLAYAESIAKTAGPLSAGGLMAITTPSFALIIDSAAFVITALCLSRIRATEPSLASRPTRQGAWKEIGDGLRFIRQNHLLLALAGSGATFQLFAYMLNALFILYMVDSLQLGPILIGIVAALGTGVGLQLGSRLASKAASRFGRGRTILYGLILAVLRGLVVLAVVVLPRGTTAVAVSALVVAQILYGFGAMLYNANDRMIRQTLVPHHRLGRVQSTMEMVTSGIPVTVGAIIGGILGNRYGIQSAIIVAGVGGVSSVLWVILSPLRNFRDSPKSEK